MMKKPLLLPLLASSLLVACATPAQNIIQNKPTMIGEQDIQRLVQESRERALNARDVQANQGETNPPVVAGGIGPAPMPKPPEVLPTGCTSQAQVDAFKQQIATFYDETDVVKKIRDANTQEVIDCVKIEKQPSLKRSGLTAKDIPRHPTGFPDAPPPDAQDPNSCPVDTVPLTRPTLRVLCNPPSRKVAPPHPPAAKMP
jgi:hypothetical protein